MDMKYLLLVLAFIAGVTYGLIYSKPVSYVQAVTVDIEASPRPSPSPSLIPTHVVVGEIARVFEPEGKGVVKQALEVAFCEGGWREDAQNSTSSAGGVFQFIDDTWVRMRKRMGVRQDLELKKNYKHNIETAYELWKLERVKWSNWECKPI